MIDPLMVIEFKDPELQESTTRKNVVRMKTRILRPAEYLELRKGLRPDYQTYFDGLLLSGMRYVEYQVLLMNPNWYDGNFIKLPRYAIRKQKATIKQRYVHLSTRGRSTLDNLWKIVSINNIPTVQGLHKTLKTAAVKSGVSSEGLNIKSFRKTWESWLVFYYPGRKDEIFLSQGHTELTALQHYVNIPFSARDREEMKDWVEGWT